MKKKGRLTIAVSYLKIVLACFISSLGLNLFFVPNNIVAGGLSGFGQILNYLFGFPIGTSYFIMNIPLFIMGWRLLGHSFSVKSLLTMGFFSLAVNLTSSLPPITEDMILAVLFGGVLMGVGLGVIFREESSTGGTTLGAKIIHNFIPFISVGQVLLLLDGLVIVMAAIIYGKVEAGLYASIAIYVTSKIIDIIMLGVNYTKVALIISEKNETISQRILVEQNRGVTELKGVGKYTGQDRPVLMCVIPARDIPHTKRIALEEDPRAFIFTSTVREVMGEGFSYDRR